MPRLLFEKTGSAIWISHLDLMRLFQRAFKRAGLQLTHTKGFNPRPSVSIALPLSVGISSRCELLDFELDGDGVSAEEILEKLNNALTDGIFVRKVYSDGRKIRDLSFLQCTLTMEYDNGIPQGAEEKISALFSREELLVEKKSKNGVSDQNIIPMIQSFDIISVSNTELNISARICCQNPSLNPLQIHGAIVRYLPECIPNHVTCCRTEIYDQQNNVFR